TEVMAKMRFPLFLAMVIILERIRMKGCARGSSCSKPKTAFSISCSCESWTDAAVRVAARRRAGSTTDRRGNMAASSCMLRPFECCAPAPARQDRDPQPEQGPPGRILHRHHPHRGGAEQASEAGFPMDGAAEEFVAQREHRTCPGTRYEPEDEHERRLGAIGSMREARFIDHREVLALALGLKVGGDFRLELLLPPLLVLAAQVVVFAFHHGQFVAGLRRQRS